MELKKGQRIYRLSPCPAYDVEGMESWLSDMASKGLFLSKDGFFAGIATFVYDEPRDTKYRLEAAQKSTSMWSENGGEPDTEQIELSEKYSWSYVGKRGDFFIFRSFEPGARDLNTDPEVQALALNAIKKRKAGTVFNIIFWCIIYPILFLRGGLLLTIITTKTWVFLLVTIIVLWMLANSIVAFISLSKLQNKLRIDGNLADTKDWKKGTTYYHGKNAIRTMLIVLLAGILIRSWSVSVMYEDRIQLDNYTGEIPFATMRDFTGDSSYYYEMTMLGMNKGFNTVKEWSDWLAPRNIDYNEQAQVTLLDGRIIDGGLYVDYHETISPLVAKRLALEYYQMDKREKDFELIKISKLDVDYAIAYMSTFHFPTIIIQNGGVVIRAYFYQTSHNYKMEFEEWVALIVNSVK